MRDVVGVAGCGAMGLPMARRLPGAGFEVWGGTIHHLGPAGAGMTCKVLNDFAAATSVLAVRRVLGAARELGVDGDRLRAVMRTSSGGTWYGDNLERIAWAREGYHPANTIGILEKDVAAYLDAADGLEGAFEAAVVDGLRALEPLE